MIDRSIAQNVPSWKSEWNNRWRNPIRYLSNRPKKTHQFSYHPTQSSYFPEESSQRDKGEDRGGEERTTFPFPLSNFPKESFLSLLLFLFSFTHIYIFLPFWRRYFYIFTSVRRTFIDRRGRRADSSQNHSLAQVPTAVPPLVWMSRLAIRRGKGWGGENGEFRGGRFLSMLITVAGVNHDRPGARSAKWVRAGWPSPNRHGPAG